MGVAGMKQLPRPSKIASFLRSLNGEAFLKVSYQNVDWFQKYKALKWKNPFLMPFSLWNCTLFTNFDFKTLYFWNRSIFFKETFRSAFLLRFLKNEAILDGRGNCLMPATPIFPKHCFFKKCPKNLTNFTKFQKYF